LEDASDTVVGFAGHVRGVKKGVQGLRGLFTKVREARVEMARMERALGYAILGMITAPIDASTNDGTEEDEGDVSEGERACRAGKKSSRDEHLTGLVNSSGSWCWRENCKGDLKCSLLRNSSHVIVEKNVYTSRKAFKNSVIPFSLLPIFTTTTYVSQSLKYLLALITHENTGKTHPTSHT
jgi:hypothetical protein